MDALSIGRAIGYARRTEDANDIISDKNDRIVELKKQIAQLQGSLQTKDAHAEGLTAMLQGFIAAHQDSPERVPVGTFDTAGKPKTVGRIRYEKAFDAYLASKGVKNPETHRSN